MQILVNHLTRMREGFICLAGLEEKTHRHIRPVVRGVGLESACLACHGGPFALGAMIDLGNARAVGQPPEVEDYRFVLKNARQTGMASPDQFWSALRGVARPQLSDLFGPDLTSTGAKFCGVAFGKGKVSLGCLTPAAPVTLSILSRPGKPGQIRAAVSDGHFHLDLAVTDIRLYGTDHLTPDLAHMQWLEPLLQKPAEVILSVGLSRPFSAYAGMPKAHWLQVNNLHPLRAPLWE